MYDSPSSGQQGWSPSPLWCRVGDETWKGRISLQFYSLAKYLVFVFSTS